MSTQLPPPGLHLQMMGQTRMLTISQLLRGGRAKTDVKRGKSKVAKLGGSPFKRGICLKVRPLAHVQPNDWVSSQPASSTIAQRCWYWTCCKNTAMRRAHGQRDSASLLPWLVIIEPILRLQLRPAALPAGVHLST